MLTDERILELVRHHAIDHEYWSPDRCIAFARAILASAGQPEPIAWESTTAGYTRYVTDSRYQKFPPEVRKWYKPYRRSECAAPTPAAPQDDQKRLVRELDVLLNGEEGAAKQASLCDVVAQVRREGIRSVQYKGSGAQDERGAYDEWRCKDGNWDFVDDPDSGFEIWKAARAAASLVSGAAVVQWQYRFFDGVKWIDWANCTELLVKHKRGRDDFEFRGLAEIERIDRAGEKG
jgi:hypothetical protein